MIFMGAIRVNARRGAELKGQSLAERRMDAAKDLLKRAVELDSAQRFSEALICYEEGIQNLLRAMGGKQNTRFTDPHAKPAGLPDRWGLPSCRHIQF